MMRILYVRRPLLYKVLDDSPDKIGLLAEKEVSDIKPFFVNIFIVKQLMLLMSLWLLIIVGSGDWKHKKKDEIIYRQIF